VADGPEKGRIVYGEFSGPILALLEPVALKVAAYIPPLTSVATSVNRR
jgi:hypothetical protein